MGNNVITGGGGNPFESFGRSASRQAILGHLLKYNKGDFLAGSQSRVVPVGTRLVAVMDSVQVGYVKWLENRPVERAMGYVSENFQPPQRNSLGDLDEALWECDLQGAPKDSWQKTTEFVLIDPEDDQVYTFPTSAKTAMSSIGKLSLAYSKAMRQRSDDYPIIALGSDSFVHSDRSIGRVKFPTFEVVGWIAKAHFLQVLGNDAPPLIRLTAPETPSIAPVAAPADMAVKRKNPADTRF